ncbi:MAG: TIGR00304 family membrane protein [Thermoplasmata archaeon]
MPWAARAVPLVLLAGGIALVAWEVATGSATFYLLVVLPVITGNSGTLGFGIFLIVMGIVLLPFSVPPEEPREETGAAPTRSSGPGGSRWGGFVLLGPLPIFFDSARPSRVWLYALVIAVGTVFFVVLTLGARVPG